MMTVGQLVADLQRFNPNLPVYLQESALDLTGESTCDLFDFPADGVRFCGSRVLIEVESV